MKKKAIMELYNPKYKCPIHGTVEAVLTSNIKDFEGEWCQLCWVEWLNKNITKVTHETQKEA